MDLNPFEYKDNAPSITEKINNFRTYERNIPSKPLQMYLDTRAVSTKYSILPIVDPRKPSLVQINQQSTYSVDKTFNPGNTGPWSGYASNINKESDLHNQLYALQSCPQKDYIPKSTSDLYKHNWTNKQQCNQPFPGLFVNSKLPEFNPNPNPNIIGNEMFNNSTRQQNKNMPTTQCYNK